MFTNYMNDKWKRKELHTNGIEYDIILTEINVLHTITQN